MAKVIEKRVAKIATRRNPHRGTSFDDFLKEEGIFEEVQAKALKRALAEQLEESMQAANLTKMKMAEKMETSRSQLDRVLDPDNVSIQLDTLIKAARALDKTVEIKIRKAEVREHDGPKYATIESKSTEALKKMPRISIRKK